jgi:hypothetical protein
MIATGFRIKPGVAGEPEPHIDRHKQKGKMAKKEAATRWTDTINYLNNKFPASRLGDHIESIVPGGRRDALAGELHLGVRFDSMPTEANKNKRHALRGLLLCQRVYYSDEFWAKQSEAGQGLNVIPLPGLLGGNWKSLSLNFWGGKTEQQVLSGIEMFVTVNTATRGDLQRAAHAGPPNGVSLPGNLALARTDQVTVGAGIICYVGVQGWLVRSGLVSMRWFMRNASPNKEVGCDLVFGKGHEVWRAPVKPEDTRNLQNIIDNIGAGYVVHIWSPENYNWNGHWVITNGDGTICGVNNGEVQAANGRPAVQKNYTNHSTLFEQFEDYGEKLTDTKWRTGVMVVIDPLTMPNRD